MTISKEILGEKLKKMYNNAPYGEKALMVHLFGIKFASIIRSNNYTAKEIMKIAGIQKSYQAEIDKGIKMWILLFRLVIISYIGCAT